MVNLEVEVGGLSLKNPVLTASGTFGYGLEYTDFLDLNKLGGFIVKGTTLEPRQGNDYPRMIETPSGMLNAVGLQNKGIDHFVNEIYPQLTKYSSEIIVNISGSKLEDYCAVAEKLSELDRINAIEVNISCPNVKEGGMAFGVTPKGASIITKEIRKKFSKTIIVKLSPNVTDITEIARATESEGADAVSMVNTFMGMAIDVEKRRPYLSTITGGLSGPAIRPIAVRMVWQTFKAIHIPIIGIGGIMNGRDALEFILAGASAVEVGTANFIDPQITIKIIDYINEYCHSHGIDDINSLIGAIHR